MTLPPASDRVLHRLMGLHPKVIDLVLDRVERLLAALDHPERKLAPVIHVAGTNGKGSTVAYLRAIFEAAGYRVHVYTSPHLVRFAERIRVAGQIIDDDALTALLEECERANGGQPITFFEITTVAAFLAFSRTPADVVLLETGLGGRLDATNVVERPALTVLTPISLDHQQYLGDTLAAIAGEKAGILKPGTPALSARQEPDAAAVIRARAAAVGAPVAFDGEGWSIRRDGDGMVYESARNRWSLPLPALIGPHQLGNAGLALACAEALSDRFTLPLAALAEGLTRVEWPARMQRLTRGPLVEALPEGWQLWLDGGHNPAAGDMLAGMARLWAGQDGLPLHVIFGMLNTKDAEGFLGPLAPHIASLHAVTIPGEANALTAEGAAAHARSQGVRDVAASRDAAEAMADIVRRPGPARVLICGSLYLAGKILAGNG